MKRSISAICLVFINAAAFAQSYDLFSREYIKWFADDLYANGFFEGAESEYKRFLFSADEGEAPDESVIFNLADIYKKTNNSRGIAWLASSFLPALSDKGNADLALLQAGSFFSNRDAESFAAFSETAFNLASVCGSKGAPLVHISQNVLQNNFTAARDLAFEAANGDDIFSPLFAALDAYKPKSAAAAVLLSAVLPGAGKWYTGSFASFFSSIWTIGAFTLASIYSFYKDGTQSWRPWAFTAGAVSLYSLELYSSAKSAKIYNAAKINEIFRETEKIYDSLY